jgi:hypothetical protein
MTELHADSELCFTVSLALFLSQYLTVRSTGSRAFPTRKFLMAVLGIGNVGIPRYGGNPTQSNMPEHGRSFSVVKHLL